MKVKTSKMLAGLASVLFFGSTVFATEKAEVKVPTATKVVEPTMPVTESSKKGEVTVLFRLSKEGRPLDIEVESSTSTALARSVENALSKWRFEGVTLDERFETSRYRLPFVFTTEG
jgi:TonB family protein